ncbi:MarR family winged helix-turn-helix transcriptional regulator [Thalassiella azotivora]
MEHAWDAHLARWDLNHASFAVLHLLEHEPMTQRQLAGRTQVQEQTMSRLVERLARTGYVLRTRSEADRRKVLVSLTPAGRSARAEAEGDHRGDVEVGFRDALGADGTRDLREQLVTLVRRLSEQRWS